MGHGDAVGGATVAGGGGEEVEVEAQARRQDVVDQAVQLVARHMLLGRDEGEKAHLDEEVVGDGAAHDVGLSVRYVSPVAQNGANVTISPKIFRALRAR